MTVWRSSQSPTASDHCPAVFPPLAGPLGDWTRHHSLHIDTQACISGSTHLLGSGRGRLKIPTTPPPWSPQSDLAPYYIEGKRRGLAPSARAHRNLELTWSAAALPAVRQRSTAARLGKSPRPCSASTSIGSPGACNPAVGGPARGQLVHEVDAPRGVIARLADARPYRSACSTPARGPGVWALRARPTSRQYARQSCQCCTHTAQTCKLREAMVTGLEVELGGSTNPKHNAGTAAELWAGSPRAHFFCSVYARRGRDPHHRHLSSGAKIWVGQQSMKRRPRRRARPPKAHRRLQALGFPPVASKPAPPPGGPPQCGLGSSSKSSPATPKGRYFSIDASAWVEEVSR